MRTLALSALVVLAGCAGGNVASSLAGRAADDPVTAKLRATFANGDTLSLAAVTQLATASSWTCSYHATTTDVVLRGYEDVTYTATFAATGTTGLHEAAAGAQSGDVAIDPWTADYRWTQAGLRADGSDATRLLRTVNGAVWEEWLYAPAAGAVGDPAIGEPNLFTAGLASCVAATGSTAGH